MPNPIHEIVIGAGLVASFWREVQVHIRGVQGFIPRRECRVGVKHAAVRVLIEHAVAGYFLAHERSNVVVIVHLAGCDLVCSERDVVVEIEVAAVGRHLRRVSR